MFSWYGYDWDGAWSAVRDFVGEHPAGAFDGNLIGWLWKYDNEKVGGRL